MKSIIVGIYIAATVVSISNVFGVSAAATEISQETNEKPRTRRLRRTTNVLKVGGLKEADPKKEQDDAMETINRILSRSDLADNREYNNESNNNKHKNVKRQLVPVSGVENSIRAINNQEILTESDILTLMRNVIPASTDKNFYSFSMPPSPTKQMATRRPTREPTNAPFGRPTDPQPTPVSRPNQVPTGRPPTPAPVPRPTDRPNNEPTRNPTPRPTDRPIKDPTYRPTFRPTNRPTPRPTNSPPNVSPVVEPTLSPMETPSGPNPLPPSSGGDTVCGDLTPNERQTLIAGQLGTYSGNRVNLPGTPQNQAFRWLIEEDAAQVCPEDFLDVQQRYILAVVYFSTDGDQWNNCNALSSASPSPCIGGDEQRFLSSSDVCFWYGITCNRLRVSGISIDENNLRGYLPDEIGYLEQIEDLDFDGELEEGLNFLVGTIPTTFGLLEKLVTLDLDSNELTGSIPEEIFEAERLTIMDLDSNELTGTLSPNFANLEELQILFLDNNGFFGSLPSEMGEMERLRFLRLDRNELSGTIPDEWEAMQKLRVMFLNNNAGISGTIPDYLGDFIDMQQLSLFDTSISGTVPSTLGKLTGLVNLFLHFTDLTGTMPQEICDLRTSGALNFLTADCAGSNPKLACSQPDCCTVCF